MLRPFEQRFPFNLDWNLLRTFMVVVERKGVSRAADFLGLKQPTISSALKRLETVAGHKLVERKPNRFQVTKGRKDPLRRMRYRLRHDFASAGTAGIRR